MNKKYVKIISIIAVIILIAVVIFFYTKKADSPYSINGEGNTIILGQKSNQEVVAKPDLAHKVIFPKDFSKEAQNIITQNVKTLSSELNTNSTSTDKWISLGIQYKIIGDFNYARDVWEYAGYLNSNLFVPFYNLGDLYHNNLKDYVKSEKNFLTAIQNNKAYIQSYEGLADLYRYSYKVETDSAKNILLEGLKNNPDSFNLMLYTADYFKSKGDIVDAKKYYNQALTQAKLLKDKNLQNQVQSAIDSL